MTPGSIAPARQPRPPPGGPIPAERNVAVSIRLLGDFAVTAGATSHTAALLRQSRLRCLLAYLLFHRDEPLLRQRIAFSFWPDTTEHQARTNLRQLFHHLRKAVPFVADHLEVDGATVLWRSAASCFLDVADFEASLDGADVARRAVNPRAQREQLQRAVGLYGGDLLADLDADWLVLERERLRGRYTAALGELASLCERGGDLDDAIAAGQRLLVTEPLDEASYRRLMALHLRKGDRTSALATYQSCATVLDRELGVAPHVDTQELRQRALRSGKVEARPVAAQEADRSSDAFGRYPLVGRHDAWDRLRRRWERAAQGAAQLAVVSGEPGIGKTRLAEEMLRWAEQEGVRTARARPCVADGRLAFAPIADWLRAPALRPTLAAVDDLWLADIARVVPEVRIEAGALVPPTIVTEASADDRLRFFEALTRAVLAETRPLILLLEDAHWCDVDTLDWVQYLLDRGRDHPLLVVATARPDEVTPGHAFSTMVVEEQRRGRLEQVALPPLDGSESAALAAHVLQRPAGPEGVSPLLRETGGNPLFIIETMRARSAARAAPPAASGDDAAPPEESTAAVPPRVLAAIRSRLDQLSSPARELLSVAALIGRGCAIDVLERASGHPEALFVRAFDELWRRELVVEDGDAGYDVSHDLVRRVAQDDVSPARSRVVHRRIAAALEHGDWRGPESASLQLAVHYDRGGVPSKAVECYLRAARESQLTFSNDTVIELLTRARELLPQLSPTERPRREYDVLLLLGSALMMTQGFSHPEVERTFERLGTLGETVGETTANVPAVAGLWLYHHVRGAIDPQTRLAFRLLEEVPADGAARWRGITDFALTGTALTAGDPAAAHDHVEQGLRAEQQGAGSAPAQLFAYDPLLALLPYGALALWLLGCPDQARRRMRDATRDAEASGHMANVVFAKAMSLVLHQWCGDLEATRRGADDLVRLGRSRRLPLYEVLGGVLAAWAQTQVQSGPAPLRQLATMIDAWRAAGASRGATYYLVLLAEANVAAGRTQDAWDAVDQGLTIVADGGERWFEAELHRWRGELLRADADADAARQAFTQAMDIARAQQAYALQLRAAMSLGSWLDEQGARGDACDVLTDVYECFTEGFDTVDLRRAQTLLSRWRRGLHASA